MASFVYDVLWTNTLGNTGVAYDLDASTGAIYMDLLDIGTTGPYTPAADTDTTRANIGTGGDEVFFGKSTPETCSGTFTLTAGGSGTNGIVVYNNTTSPVATFTGLDGDLDAISLYWAAAGPTVDTDYKLICYFDSGTGIGSTLVSADVDVTFDTGTNKIFRIVSGA